MGVSVFNGGARAFRTRDERSLLWLLDDSSASVLTNFLTTVLISVVGIELPRMADLPILKEQSDAQYFVNARRFFFLSFGLIKLLASFAQFYRRCLSIKRKCHQRRR